MAFADTEAGSITTAAASGAQFGMKLVLLQLLLIVPPLTLLGAARGGARALVVNLAGAALIALLAWGLAALTGGGAQFLFLGLGAYAVFSWASAMMSLSVALSVMAGVLLIRFISALRRAMTGFGVAAGTITPFQASASKPG